MPISVVSNPRSRLLQKVKRIARRWGTVAFDTFNRPNEDGLGNTDTGHNWTERIAGSSSAAPHWRLAAGKATIRSAIASTHLWATIGTGLSDVKIKVAVTVGSTITSPGAGLFFRGNAAGDGVVFSYISTTQWRWGTLIGGVHTAIATVSSPVTLVAGQTYELELRLSGSTCQAYLDGTQIGTNQTIATFQTETKHGLYTRQDAGHVFNNFRVYRN